jgi:hypothetical protein
MMDQFDCEDVGKLVEFVGCKVDHNQNKGSMSLTQPVVIQTFQDKFELPEGRALNTPAIPGTVMSEGKIKDQVNDNDETQSTDSMESNSIRILRGALLFGFIPRQIKKPSK